MRDYGTVSPQFWIGKTGKALRGNTQAQLLALYLMTSPRANMIGVFHCPVLYMSYETGIPIEGASGALRSLIEADFCQFDEDTEEVFVKSMARFQIGDALSPADKRCVGVARELDKVCSSHLQRAFVAIYSVAFNLPEQGAKSAQDASPLQAPCKPLRSQEQEQEQEHISEAKASSSAAGGLPTVPAASVFQTAADRPVSRMPVCQYQAVVDLYHELLPELPRCRIETQGRQRAMKRMWTWVLTSTKGDGARRAETSQQALAWFRTYFAHARENDFLMGRTPRTGSHAGWRCDLDFLLSDAGMKQVVEKTEVAA